MTSQVMVRGARTAHTARMKLLGPYVTAALLAAAVFHLLPAVGVLGAQRLSSLYGVTIPGDALLVLMRHRALLFALLGAFMLHAAWSPALQAWALVLGLVSTGGFVLLAWNEAWLPAPLRLVMWIDVALFVALAAALLARVMSR